MQLLLTLMVRNERTNKRTNEKRHTTTRRARERLQNNQRFNHIGRLAP